MRATTVKIWPQAARGTPMISEICLLGIRIAGAPWYRTKMSYRRKNRGRVKTCQTHGRIYQTLTTEELIDSLTHRRQELWSAGGGEPGEVTRLAHRIDDLYAQRRIERASHVSGSREEISRRARIEVELERMMAQTPS